MPTSRTFTLLLQHQRYRDKRQVILLALGVVLALLFSLCAGDRWIWPSEWFSDRAQLFVWQLRLPRALAVMLVGAALAVAGAVMQALFENPLAEPGLLGVANGAGVALAMTFLLLGFARRRRLTNARLLLVGVALGIVCSALMTWAVYFSTSLDLRQLMYWMMGGFGGVDWRQKWLVLALLPVLLWLCGQGRALNLMALGEVQARQLGLSLHLWRNLLVLAIGWLVGVSVALAGVIGFVGLVIPHILRLTGLTDQRYLLPACALAGAGVLLVADVIARVALLAAELPIGVVTATLGAPLFIWLLTRAKGVR